MKSMRSWLFVPGHRLRMIDKALGLPADMLIFDLEDGVPEAEKDVARSRVAAALDSVRGGPMRFVRVHDAGSSELDADLQVIAHAQSAGTGGCASDVPMAGPARDQSGYSIRRRQASGNH
ncbi:MAG: hypothetical protein J4F29_23110 [Candidatus Latescibacteria bacterium]|nr:hypothetical protein [Candidatus Latescibacterota bacterium]